MNKSRIELFTTGLVAFTLIVTTSFTFPLSPKVSTRLKDISRLINVRDNQLIGYGMVVGLAGTGDGSSNLATLQGISNMLSNFGVQIDPTKLNASNVAAVMVVADLKPFSEPGDRIDVVVSSIGKAKSLRGGVLLLTPLKGANGSVYAVSQGPVLVTGFSVSSKGNSRKKGHTTTGRIPNGAIVEDSVETTLVVNESLVWVLDNEDFETIKNVKESI